MSDWYGKFYEDSNMSEPASAEDAVFPKPDKVLVDYLRAGGSLVEYIKERAADPERIAHGNRVRAALDEILSQMGGNT